MSKHCSIPSRPLAFVLHYCRRHFFLSASLIFWSAVIAFTGIAAPYFLKPLIDLFVNAESINTVNWQDILPIMLGFVFVGFVLRDTVACHAAHISRFLLTSRVKMEIRNELFDYTLDHAPSYLQDEMSGRLANKIMDSETQAEKLIILLCASGVQVAVFICLSICVAFWLYPSYGFFLLGWTVVYMSITLFLARKAPTLSKHYSEERSTMVGQLVDVLSCFSVIKQFARNHDELLCFSKSSTEVQKKELKLWWFLELIVLFQGFIKILLFGALIPILYYGWKNGDLTAGAIAFLIPLTIEFEHQIYTIRTHTIEGLTSLGILHQALGTLKKPHNLQDHVQAKKLKITNADLTYKALKFSYPGHSPVFHDLNIHIPSGQKLGLIGPSGAGKSTLINLLLRFYDLDQGEILIDGQNIAQITQKSLREQIAIIPQDTTLFHRSLMDNIRYGKPNASKNAVIEAAKKAHAHDFIQDLPQGYKTLVGERGVKLSGGQRQRIIIARAILKDAPILILDEATSALDSESERLIQESLKELMQSKTVIAIAHRLSTISHLDRLLIMDQGEIVEDGTHTELLEQNGLYTKLWALQSGGFLGE